MIRIALILSFAFLASCSVLKEYDTTGFTIEGNIVYYNNNPMAELRAVEFAYDDRKLIKELTFSLLNGNNNDKIYNLDSVFKYSV